MHSLKGDASSLGLAGIAHAVENVLEQLRSRELVATGEIVSLLLQCIDALRKRIRIATAGGDPARVGDLPLLDPLHEEVDRLFGDLQGIILEARMVPIEETFRGYTWAVRDIARTRGKLARLEYRGAGGGGRRPRRRARP